jgi:hypothetical protein
MQFTDVRIQNNLTLDNHRLFSVIDLIKQHRIDEASVLFYENFTNTNDPKSIGLALSAVDSLQHLLKAKLIASRYGA